MILVIIVTIIAVAWVMNNRQADQVREDLPPVVATIDAAATGGCNRVFWTLVIIVLLTLAGAPVVALLEALGGAV